MSKWYRLEQYKKAYQFIGPRAVNYLIIGIIAGLLAFGAELTFAYVLQMFLVILKIIPVGSLKFPNWLPTDNMYIFLGFVSLVLVIRGTAQWLNAYLTMASCEIQRDYQRFRLMEWALRAPSVNAGELMTLYNDGVSAVCNVLMSLQTMTVTLSTSLLIWIALLRISVFVTTVATFILFLIGFAARSMDRKVKAQGKNLVMQFEQINIRLLNNIKNLLLVQIYGTQETEKKAIKEKLDFAVSDVLDYHRKVNLKNVVPNVLGMILICGLCIAATRRDWIAPTLILTYFYLFLRFVQNFSDVVKLNTTIAFNFAPTVKMANWWAHNSHDGVHNPIASAKEQISAIPASFSIGWNLRDVSYSYPNSSTRLLSKFSIEIKPGSALVMTGESGSGKSTFLSLLLGINKPTHGEIDLRINGKTVGLEEMQKSLLARVGYVGSESFLIEGTILENLLYGLNEKPSDAVLAEVLEKTGCQS